MSTSPQCVRTWAAAAFATALAGCAVGPQYVRPQIPAIVLASPQAAEFAAADADAAPIAWWQVFEDEGLSRWIEAALARNHDIRQAQANLLAARAIFDERRLDRLPGVTSGAGYSRGIQQQASNGGQRTLSESWQAGFDVQWEVDLFGRLDRLQQAAMARAEASQAELEMTRLSIAAEVARTWFEAQGYRRQLEVTRQEAGNWRETVRLAQASLHAGAGLPEEVENAQANLLRSEAELPALVAALQQARHRLDVLAGQRPGQGGLPEPDAVRAAPLVARVPLGDVNRMILARPDVMQAERLLAAGVEDVGAATADLYPRIDLGGFLGFFALRDGDFASAASRAFQIAPTVSWPAPRLGNARARLRGAEALSDGAMARYEQVLLAAQQEVESAVTQVVEQQRQLAGLLQAAQHAQAAFAIAERRYRAGAGSYQVVLENQRTLFQLRRQIAQQEVDAHIHIVTLSKALGWNVPFHSSRGGCPGRPGVQSQQPGHPSHMGRAGVS